jgi:transposase InsO family protein
MPWRKLSVMEERFYFINECRAGYRTITDICKDFGISRTLAYRYLDRFERFGMQGLEDRSRTPHSSPNETPKAVVDEIIKLRKEHPRYGPEKLLTKLSEAFPDTKWPAESTINLILKRNNLIPERRRIRRIEKINPIFDPSSPNEIWSGDFKGKFRTGDRSYVYPLTIADSFSRFLFAAAALAHPTFQATRDVFIDVFRKFGLPLQLHTDNGCPFAGPTSLARLSCLAVWLLEHDVLPVYSDPGCPSQNGRHERMHRELKADAARPPARNLTLEQKKLDAFVQEYNFYRPHNALGNKTPASVHVHSQREYRPYVEPWDYPSGFAVRRVFRNGAIRWGSDAWIMVSTALIGKDIGLEELGNGIWRVYFRSKLLGYLDEEQHRIQDINGRLKRKKCKQCP